MKKTTATTASTVSPIEDTKTDAKKKTGTVGVEIPHADAIRIILELAIPAGEQLGVPALIGPTHWGKTVLGKEVITKLGYTHTRMVNLQLDVPEDIGGYPVRKGMNVEFSKPSIFPTAWKEGNFAFFLDELDKAHKDSLSAVLSLLAEGRIRESILPAGVGRLVAMNEPEVPLYPAICSRLLFLAWPPKNYALATREDFKLWPKATTMYTLPSIALPEIPKSPAAWHKLVAWAKHPELFKYSTVRQLVIQGLFPPRAIRMGGEHCA